MQPQTRPACRLAILNFVLLFFSPADKIANLLEVGHEKGMQPYKLVNLKVVSQ